MKNQDYNSEQGEVTTNASIKTRKVQKRSVADLHIALKRGYKARQLLNNRIWRLKKRIVALETELRDYRTLQAIQVEIASKLQ